ncbi:hypothetical protein BRADI_3g19382v3 [Brachypodium distachyon]|uniref:Uncharacterized protein n=1 Tax=Brachypodium distachyon TaxID=15368 RepID=A0A0Q3LTV6_BRADI|nr:hypothetical protein BRADI_3g19382v3 [Brachypodium distachyon]
MPRDADEEGYPGEVKDGAGRGSNNLVENGKQKKEAQVENGCHTKAWQHATSCLGED